MLPAYVEERLSESDRGRFRAHLRDCDACREFAVAADPSLLFAAAPLPPVDAHRVEACVHGVQALIAQERLERRLRRPVRGWLAAAAALLMVVGAGVMWRLRGDVAADQVPPSAAARAADERVSPGPPQIDVEMDGEGVRVYQYAQQEDDNTAVYFIVNSSLES